MHENEAQAENGDELNQVIGKVYEAYAASDYLVLAQLTEDLTLEALFGIATENLRVLLDAIVAAEVPPDPPAFWRQ